MRPISSLTTILILSILLFAGACKKSSILTNGGSIRFSSDTLLFDTVFTAMGSATYKVKIFNEQNQPVRLSSVRLGKGDNSSFKLNVNGEPGNDIKDQELAAKDSLYVYSTVTIDPNATTTPFVVEDELIATLNGKEFSIPVIAYGQNARYIYDSVLNTQTWDNALPYVIINNALVDKGQTLTINAGCRIYVHPNSRLYVEGSLIVNGTKNDSVVFQTDRIDRSYYGYLDFPGEWGGLYFTENSSGNLLKWTLIKNCGNSTSLGNNFVQAAAIQVDNNKSIINANEGVRLENCIVQNSIGYGLLSFGGKVSMSNCLVNTCGAQNIGVFQGGNFEFTQCTFVTYGTRFVSHADAPVMSLLNYLDTSETGFIPGNLKVVTRNCIVYGSLDDELICNGKNLSGSQFDIRFENCLIKAQSSPHPSVVYSNCILNQDPMFEDTEKWDYHLKSGSPAISAAAPPFIGNNLDDMPSNGNMGAF